MSRTKERTMAQIVRARPDIKAELAQHSVEMNIRFLSRCICCGRVYDTLADLGSNCIGYMESRECRGDVFAVNSSVHGGSDNRTSAEIKEAVLAKHNGIQS